MHGYILHPGYDDCMLRSLKGKVCKLLFCEITFTNWGGYYGKDLV